jgi:cystathionine beta-lyase/cystathionine gamma-synthase
MTLAVRIREQSASAMTLARWLEHHSRIRRAHYPGITSHPGHEIAAAQMSDFGGILAIDLGGGREAAMAFMRGLRLIRLGASLGGVETLATHPATSSHRMLTPEAREALGIGDGLIRFSVGLEDVEDLQADIESALEASGQPAA